jgi:hypothetical protein
MKTKTLIKIIIITAILFLLFGCADPGVTSKDLTGYEEELPFELRGLKVYTVSTGEGSYVKVALFPEREVNSTTYSVGKSTQTTIIINSNTRSERIVYGTIISENDSIIVIKK